MKNEEFFRLHWKLPEGETIYGYANRIFPIAQRLHVTSARHGSPRLFACAAYYWSRKIEKEKEQR